jgi:hypothetical protein
MPIARIGPRRMEVEAWAVGACKAVLARWWVVLGACSTILALASKIMVAKRP